MLGGSVAGILMTVLAGSVIVNAPFIADALAQSPPAPTSQTTAAQPFNAEQLDALVASIALYPDELLTHVLMASTFPLEIVAAARWLEDPAHKPLSGDALAKALESEPWDPNVKALLPFPVVLATMNNNLSWLQQLGYAFATQQADVFAAVQRLRQQAQANGNLQSSPEQVVSTEQVAMEPASGGQAMQKEVVVIQSAQPNTVYVPTYNPATVYGSWPYPSYPPYYAAPPAGYYFGTALATGVAFAAGAAIVGGLWGWARPAWGGGYANVNVNRYNNINVNRPPINSSRWSANSAGGRPVNFPRSPSGPVGLPGRSQVSVPRSAVRPPTRPGGAGVGSVGRPGGPGGVGSAGGINRPGSPGGVGGINRPTAPGRPGGTVGSAGRPAQRPSGAAQRSNVQRPGGAFGTMSSGRQASQFTQRGAQSRSFNQQRSAGGGGRGGFSGGGRGGSGRRGR